jgi:hypothetical protein
MGPYPAKIWAFHESQLVRSSITPQSPVQVPFPQLKPTGSYRTDRRVNQKAAVETRRLFSSKRDSPQQLPPTSRAGVVSPAPARDSRPPLPNLPPSPKVSNSLSRAVSRVNDWSAS